MIKLVTVALSLAVVASPLRAESVSASMGVSVQVIARANLTVASQPAAVTVTESDIARGYVDVQEPISIQVRTNSRSGYVLQAEKSSDEVFSKIALTNDTVSLTVSSHETWLQRPYAPGGDVLSMRARLFLAERVAPGTHHIGLTFTASAL